MSFKLPKGATHFKTNTQQFMRSVNGRWHSWSWDKCSWEVMPESYKGKNIIRMPMASEEKVIDVQKGQKWWVKLPGDRNVSCRYVLETTSETVVLAQKWSEYIISGERFALRDVEFVELINSERCSTVS